MLEQIKTNVLQGSVLVQCEKGRTDELRGLLTLCEKLRSEGVVGVELTCSQTMLTTQMSGEGGSVESLLFSAEDISFMQEARQRKIRSSVEAGEYGPPDMVFQAVEKLQADRVVFGYSVTQVKYLPAKLC